MFRRAMAAKFPPSANPGTFSIMARRLKVPRLAEASTGGSAGDGPHLVDPPSVTAIRMVYGVGPGNGEPPTDATFKSTYHVGLPVFSIGGLDPDGVYEFDAAQLFDVISKRSLRRKWGMRLELELGQSAETVGKADIWVETPFEDSDGAPSMHVVGKSGTGIALPGGGRRVVVATSLIHDSKRVASLSGIYSVQLRDTDPSSDDKPGTSSMARGINVDLTRFEFEG